MSEIADSFTALGAGNGFPFCPSRVDVDDFNSWTTLGGFNKNSSGSPSNEQIQNSLRNAMRLFWNFRGLNFQAKAEAFKTPPNQSASANTLLNTTVLDPDEQPFKRVCKTNTTSDALESDTTTFGDNFIADGDGDQETSEGGVVTISRSSVSLRFARFYLNNEYIGLGLFHFLQSGAIVGSSISVSAFSNYMRNDSIVSSIAAGVSLTSATNEENRDDSIVKRDVGYVVLDGIHFVATASLSIDVSNQSNLSVSAANLLAFGSDQRDPIEFNSSFTFPGYEILTDVSISDIKFWEYD